MLLLLLIAKVYCSYLLNMFYINDLNLFSRKAILADFRYQFSAHIFYEISKELSQYKKSIQISKLTIYRPCLFRNIYLFIYFHHYKPVYWNNWGISQNFLFSIKKKLFLYMFLKIISNLCLFFKMWVNEIYGMHGKHYNEIDLN